jgi:membrane-bound lytic murein transglycosylase B
VCIRYRLTFIAHFLIVSPLFEEANLNERPLFEITQISTHQQHDQTYPDRLTSLIEYFKSQDIDLESHLDHPKFEIYDGIGDRFRKSAERKIGSLEDYLQVLGFEDKKGRIVDFMNSYSNALRQAEQNYGIPKYVIAAIIGIESDFGQNIGSYNPLNVYVSMYTEDYRADFAKAQLEELLLFTNRNDIDVFELKSSYAGAMSYGQFIPYSINRWFVGDDIFDMENNIHSIGNYLAHFHEITGSLEGAVYRYNPSSLYRDAVLTLADAAEQEYISAE